MGYGIEQATELKDCFPPDLDGGCCILVHPSAVHVSTVLDVIRMSFGCHSDVIAELISTEEQGLWSHLRSALSALTLRLKWDQF